MISVSKVTICDICKRRIEPTETAYAFDKRHEKGSFATDVLDTFHVCTECIETLREIAGIKDD